LEADSLNEFAGRMMEPRELDATFDGSDYDGCGKVPLMNWTILIVITSLLNPSIS